MTAHYEVVVYADDKRRDGQLVAFTSSQEQAAKIADEMRASGCSGVEIKRYGAPDGAPEAL